VDKAKLQIYSQIIMNIGRLLSLARLYNDQHPAVKAEASEVFAQLTDLVLKKEASLTIAESAGIMLVNAEEIKPQDNLTRRFLKDFQKLKLSSLELRPGLTQEEFNCLIELLNQKEQLQGVEQIKEYLAKKGTRHIQTTFASYKLVKEDIL